MKKKILAGIMAGMLLAGGLPGNVYGAEAHSKTVYEVFVYSFYDSDGDGIGDLKGLTEKLDYINDGDASTDTDLGCDGIWLMPIMPSTTYHKYDVTDYMNVDKEYGSLEDFKALVKECHDRGIRVYIDLVMNHTSSGHPWFQEAAEYMKTLPEGGKPEAAECPYVDYYNFSDHAQAGYNKLAGTGWYYESRFWSEMPDLRLDNPAVRKEFEKIVDFWLELGADGFRLDAAKEYYSDKTAENVEVLSWFNQMVKEKKEDAYIVAEVWSDMETYGKYYESGIDSCFDFAFAGNEGIIADTVKRVPDYNASSYGKALVNLQEILDSQKGMPVDAPFYTNHDMARGAGYYSGEDSEKQTKIAQAMNLTMSGSAFLYYGEELGMKGSGKDENFRAPMYWSKDKEAEGMCHGPKDMTSIKMKYGSLEEQAQDETSVYHYVKEAVRLRNTYPEITEGTVSLEEGLSGENVCAVRKTCGDSEILLLYNISGGEETVDLSGAAVSGRDVSNLQITEMLLTDEKQPKLAGGVLTLPPYAVVLMK